ncbi:Hypothetical_protein [Hexamita inflata]|uniref:Hypothetical_protein n=1 Tax=Hexamita inflata TaxID=28002 RepID=A0AA86TYM7_9EUKA|nr:Hypothetical protein HINF_LOCUS20986 [Hexamita inflata]
MSSCPCYKSKFQFDESLRVEHLLINIHSHNSGSVVASKLEEISQKLVLGGSVLGGPGGGFFVWRIFQIEGHDQRSNNMQNMTKQFSRCDLLLKTSPIIHLNAIVILPQPSKNNIYFNNSCGQ